MTDKPKVKKRRILGYGYKSTKENLLDVLHELYGLCTLGLPKSEIALEREIKFDREEGSFPKSAKARKFRIVLEELE